MKIVIVAVAGLILGMGGGAMVSALRVKGEILEARAQAAADSASAEHGVAAAHGDEGGVSVVLPVDEGATHEEEAAPADSMAHDPEADSARTNEADTAAAAHADESADTVASDAGAEHEPSGDSASATPGEPGPASGLSEVVLNPEGARKLAKIFGAMKPADAAAVLTEMTDAEVKTVLLQMNDRQAAPILGNFPPERAAALSQVVLRDRGGA